MKPTTTRKLKKLHDILGELERILIAYSGGVDSSFLLAEAVEVLGRRRVLAVTAVSATSTRDELRWARRLARQVKARHVTVDSREFDNPDFLRNDADRCYHCKRERFAALTRLAAAEGLRFVVDGTNADDVNDYRPGMRAVTELGIRSPLLEAGMTKADIRAAASARGLAGWSRPAAACLASRIPYGEALTPEKLAMVDRAERSLGSLGFEHVRVRTHELAPGTYLARIELPREALAGLDEKTAAAVERRLRRIGYIYVTVDLGGYRTGSLNRLLPPPSP